MNRFNKKNKLSRELGHEKNNYYVMFKGSKSFWKVFAKKASAEKAAETLRKKGREVSVGPTAASVSESIEVNKMKSTNNKKYDCKKCKGTGKLKAGVKCPHCSGTGRMDYKKEETLEEQKMKTFFELREGYKIPSNYAAMMQKKKRAERKKALGHQDLSKMKPNKKALGHQQAVGEKLNKNSFHTSVEQIDELTDKQKAEIAARRAMRMKQKEKKAEKAAAKKAEKEKTKGSRGPYMDREKANIIMQMRSAQDLTNVKSHELSFHRGKTGTVSRDDINAALAFHDKLAKPADKRKFRIKLMKGGAEAVKNMAAIYRKTTGK